MKYGINSKIFGADSRGNCIGKFFVDEFWEMPKLAELQVKDLIDYCHRNSITNIIPTRDGELSFFAVNKEKLLNHGISVMISEKDCVGKCLDKLEFYKHLSILGFSVIPTYESITAISSNRYVVKERYGAGSRNIAINVNRVEAETAAIQMENPIFQPYIKGTEYSVDLYLDRHHKVKGCLARTRDYVMNGESQVTTSIKNEKLEYLVSNLAEEMKLYGHVIFQSIIDHEGSIHIIECNPRFGGASTLSVEMGLDSFYWFILESNGVDIDTIPFVRSEKEKKLIRYPEDMIK